MSEKDLRIKELTDMVADFIGHIGKKLPDVLWLPLKKWNASQSITGMIWGCLKHCGDAG